MSDSYPGLSAGGCFKTVVPASAVSRPPFFVVVVVVAVLRHSTPWSEPDVDVREALSWSDHNPR